MARAARLLTENDITSARRSLAGLHDRGDRAGDTECFVGFDGFVDSIIDAVAIRHAPGSDGYERMTSLRQFADHARAAAGRSANIELVVKDTRVGGAGPILAGALAKLNTGIGASVHCLGATDHPIFNNLRDACASCVSLCEPGATDAIEFDDGKLMLGKAAPMDRITWDTIITASGGIEALTDRCNSAHIIAPCGWTMIPAMNDIWSHMASDILPRLEQPADKVFFVDLSDPAKRPEHDLRNAIELLKRINKHTPVTMGLNLAEAQRIGDCMGIQGAGVSDAVDPESIASLAESLRNAIDLNRIAVHHHRAAAIADNTGVCATPTAFTPTPLTSTGAGDHFNAGLCFALAHGLAAPTALACAVAVSGLFVRTGRHPPLVDVISFLDKLPPTGP